jgi:hypothetical protein
MLTISRQQVFDRWDILPENLREELVSDVNSNFLWQTCETEHIPNEKIYAVSRITGAVIMGFLHPEDMANEVRDALGIDIRIATSIAGAINQRVFAPIRKDIDRIYYPSAGGTATPKILEEIRAPIAELLPTSTPAPLPALSPVVPTSVTAPPAPKQEPIKPVIEKMVPLDEFAQFGKNTAPPESSLAPKPVVLRTESIPRPIPNAPNFRVPTIAENIMGGKKGSESLPTASAVIEFGGVPIPRATPASQSSTAPKVTAIRYGSEKVAPSVMPPKPEPMRTITEITPETLKTSVPVPKAPTPPAFAPLSQIPVPSPKAPKPPAPTTPTAPAPPAPLKPAD